eukprot:XP_001608759.1 hypothetical protein [Babesia bovis T2Bo]
MLSVRAAVAPLCNGGVTKKAVARAFVKADSFVTKYRHRVYSTSLNEDNKQPLSHSSSTVLMEPTTLCKEAKQASKGGKNVWKTLTKRAIQIKDLLSIKHMAIIIHSCANAPQAKQQLPELIKGLEANIKYHLENSGTDHNIDLYHVYSILHGVNAAEYRNADLDILLKRTAIRGFKAVYNNANGALHRPFAFEDVVGIIHGLIQTNLDLDKTEIILMHDLFLQLYNHNVDTKAAITPRAFAIGVNSLERLGCHSHKLGTAAAEYIQKNVALMDNMKDVAMIYCALVKLHSVLQCSTGATEYDSSIQCPAVVGTDGLIAAYDLMHITAVVMQHLIANQGMFASYAIDAQSLANIAAHAGYYAELDSKLMMQYKSFVSMAVSRVMQRDRVDASSLVNLMRAAIKIQHWDDALLMVTAKGAKGIGMISNPIDFARFLYNINALESAIKTKSMTQLMQSTAVTNMLYFKDRLERPPVTVKPKAKRIRSLKELIKAECKSEDTEEKIYLYNDLDKHFRGIEGFKIAAKMLLAVGNFSGHKVAYDIAQYIVKMMHKCGIEACDLDTIGAAATGLYR